MKRLNKVLAVLLSLVILFTAIPVAVFASTPTRSTGSSENTGGSAGGDLNFTLTTPNQVGVGATGKITLTLNPADVIAALRAEGDLPTKLIELIKQSLEANLNEPLITVDEIIEMIPVGALMDMLKKDDELLNGMIAELGGIDAVIGMLTGDEGFLGLTKLEATPDALINFVLGLTNLSTFVNAGEAYKVIKPEVELLFSKEPGAVQYLKDGEDGYLDRVGSLTPEQLFELVGEKIEPTDSEEVKKAKEKEAFKKLLKLLYIDELIHALAVEKPELLKDELQLDALESVFSTPTQSGKTILDILRADYEDGTYKFLTTAGVAKLDAMVKAIIDARLEKEPIDQADFIEGKLWELVNTVLPNDDAIKAYIDEAKLQDALLADTTISSKIITAIKEDFTGKKFENSTDRAYIEARITSDALTAFEAWVQQTQAADQDAEIKPEEFEWKAAHFQGWYKEKTLTTLRNNGTVAIDYNNYQDCFKTDEFLGDYLPALKEIVKAAPRTYLTDTVVDELESGVMNNIDWGTFNGEDYQLEALFTLLQNKDPAHPLAKDVDLLALVNEDHLMELATKSDAEGGIASYIKAHLNTNALTQTGEGAIVDLNKLLELILKPGETVEVLFVEGMFAEFIKLQAHIDQIKQLVQEDPTKAETLVDINGLVASLSDRYPEIIGLLDTNKVIACLKPQMNKLIAAARKLLTADKIKNYATPVLASLAENIDLISINGYDIIKEQAAGVAQGMVGVDVNAMLSLIASLIPTLSEIANTDGTLPTINLYAEYMTYARDENGLQMPRSKDINLVIKLEGDLEPLRKLAAKLDQLIDINVANGMITVRVQMPAAITEAYKKLLESDAGADLKKQLLKLADKEGADFAEALENLTLDDLIAVLSKVDLSQIYATLSGISQVETVLELLVDKLGLSYTVDELQDLDTLLDAALSESLTLQKVLDAVEARFGKDVDAVLMKAADIADNNALAQKLINALKKAPFIGTYATKVLDQNTVSELLEKCKNTDPVEVISNYIKDRFGKDVKQLILDNDINDLYDAALVRLAAYETYYNRARSFVLRVLDPNYTPVSRWEKLVKTFLPDGLLDKLLNLSVSDLYLGNGSFGAKLDSITLDLGKVSNKLMTMLEDRIALGDDIKTILENLLPQDVITFGLDAAVKFQNLSEVTYLDKDGNKLLTTYLANGVDPAIAIAAPTVEGSSFIGWVDVENELLLDTVAGDVTLRAVYSGVYTVTVKNAAGDFVKTYSVEAGKYIPAELFELLPALSSPAHGGKMERRWTKNGEACEEQDLTFQIWIDTEFVYTDAEYYDVTVKDASGKVHFNDKVDYGTKLPADVALPALAKAVYGGSMERRWTLNGAAFAQDLLTVVFDDSMASLAQNSGFVFQFTDVEYFNVVLMYGGQAFGTYKVDLGAKLPTGITLPAAPDHGGSLVTKWTLNGEEFEGDPLNTAIGTSIAQKAVNGELVFELEYSEYFKVTVQSADGSFSKEFELKYNETLPADLGLPALEAAFGGRMERTWTKNDAACTADALLAPITENNLLFVFTDTEYIKVTVKDETANWQSSEFEIAVGAPILLPTGDEMPTHTAVHGGKMEPTWTIAGNAYTGDPLTSKLTAEILQSAGVDNGKVVFAATYDEYFTVIVQDSATGSEKTELVKYGANLPAGLIPAAPTATYGGRMERAWTMNGAAWQNGVSTDTVLNFFTVLDASYQGKITFIYTDTEYVKVIFVDSDFEDHDWYTAGSQTNEFELAVGEKLPAGIAKPEHTAPNHGLLKYSWTRNGEAFNGDPLNELAIDADVLNGVTNGIVTFEIKYVEYFTVTVNGTVKDAAGADADTWTKTAYVEFGKKLPADFFADLPALAAPTNATQHKIERRWSTPMQTILDTVFNMTLDASANGVITYTFADTNVYKVSFEDENGKTDLAPAVWVDEGGKLKEDQIPSIDPTKYGLYNGSYIMVWYQNGVSIGENAKLASIVITAPTLFVYGHEVDVPYFTDHDDSHEHIEVTRDPANMDHWTVTSVDTAVGGTTLEMAVSLSALKNTGMKKLTLENHDGKLFMEMNEALLQKLIAAMEEAGVTELHFAANLTEGEEAKVTMNHSLYTFKANPFSLKIYLGEISSNKTFDAAFEGGMEISLPFADYNSQSQEQRTVVYIVKADGSFEGPIVIEAGAMSNGAVSFSAPHFSNYVVVNEYRINSVFNEGLLYALDNTGAQVLIDGNFYVPGGVAIKLRPVLNEANRYNKYIEKITYTDGTGEQEVANVGGAMTMPTNGHIPTVTVAVKDYPTNLYYMFGGQINADKTVIEQYIKENFSTIVFPKGYTLDPENITWVGATSYDGNAYLSPKLTPITYKVIFGSNDNFVEFTVLSFSSVYAVPVVPKQNGVSGEWMISTAGGDMVLPATVDALIDQMDSENKLEAKAVYNGKTYQLLAPAGVTLQIVDNGVALDGIITAALFGKTVKVNVPAVVGYKNPVIKCVELLNGTEIAVDQATGTFIMPNANVRITVEWTPEDISFKATNRIDGKFEEVTAPFGTIATFKIQVPKNSILSVAPAAGLADLVGFEIRENGTKVYTYAVALNEEFVNGTEINYEVKVKSPAVVTLANSLLSNAEAPESAIKGLTFAGFAAAPEALKFENAQYSIAQYTPEVKEESNLWVWILLAAVLLIGLIILFYNLYINGKLKPNFLLRFVTWLVSIFFNICLGISAVVLWITQGTTKKEKIDFNEFGMKDPTDPVDEPVILPVPEEEAKEEPAEETPAEEATEEATEEISEEADGEDAAPAALEVVEDAVAVDAAAEAAPAEEATAEEAEAVEEPAAEAVEAVEAPIAVEPIVITLPAAEPVAEAAAEEAAEEAEADAEEAAAEASEPVDPIVAADEAILAAAEAEADAEAEAPVAETVVLEDGSEVVEVVETVETVETVIETVETVEAVEEIEPVEELEAVEAVEELEAVDTAEAAEAAEAVEAVEANEDAAIPADEQDAPEKKDADSSEQA